MRTRRPHFLAFVLAMMLGAPHFASAQDVAAPVFNSPSPNPLRVEGLFEGQLEVSADGANLWPDMADDGTFEGYMHIFVRTSGPDGRPGPWLRCTAANGCAFFAGNSDNLTVRVDPVKLDLKTGVKLELRYWMGQPSAQEPQDATGPHTDWSNIAHWDVVGP